MSAEQSPAAAAGWYDDPLIADVQRWWDGEQWTAETRPVPRPWVVAAPAAATLGRFIAVGATLAGLICLAAAAAALIRQRPTDGLTPLLVPGIPLLAAGQVFTILVLRSRMPHRRHGGVQASSGRSGMRRLMVGGLRRPAVVVFYVVSVGSWLLAMTAIPWITRGGPGGSTAQCPFVLSNHGVITCVTEATYLHAGAAAQRFATGILASFYAVHAVVAASAIVEGTRRSADAAEPGASSDAS